MANPTRLQSPRAPLAFGDPQGKALGILDIGDVKGGESGAAKEADFGPPWH
jgi:hypothetical protein